MTKQFETPKHENLSRRKLLKVIAATSGAVVASQMMPTKWAKPVIEAGVLPTHAQGSPGAVDTTTLVVTLTWFDDVDMNLLVQEPNGDIAQGSSATQTLRHSGDVDGDPGGSSTEQVTNRTNLNSGTYRVIVQWASSGNARVVADPQPTLTIETHNTQTTIALTGKINNGDQIVAATVEFNSGSITELV